MPGNILQAQFPLFFSENLVPNKYLEKFIVSQFPTRYSIEINYKNELI